MVKTVREALKITFRKTKLSYEALQIVLSEAEATVNSRSLAYIDDDNTQLLTLTPSHFLIGHSNTGFNIDTKLLTIK